jgi:RTX calcium-binding nonapeptide repeat (4 copies)
MSVDKNAVYWGYGGDDKIYIVNREYLNIDGVFWWIPSIVIGGNGNDKYSVGAGTHTFIADGSKSNEDHLVVYDFIDKINVLFSIEERHIYISTSNGTSIVLFDALNEFGAVEKIEFLDVSYNNFYGKWITISARSLMNYRSLPNQTFESLISSGYFNPKIMGVNSANEVRDIINKIYKLTTATYTLTPSAAAINEGSTLTISVATTDVASGTALYYSLSGIGINTADFSSGSLTGSGTVSSSGSFAFSHALANDQITEGTETLEIKLFSDSDRTVQVGSTASVSIADTSLGLALTYYNSNTNKTLDTWNVYQVLNSVKSGDIVSQWFGTAAPATQQIQDVSNKKLMDVVANTWSDRVQINRVAKATDAGGKIEAKQIDFGSGEVVGSVVSGGIGNDIITGYAGWDILDGGLGNDLIHGGNGRDELHGDFGWNTYKNETDGVSDLIAIKSDHYLVN